jgi:hypothetical protein
VRLGKRSLARDGGIVGEGAADSKVRLLLSAVLMSLNARPQPARGSIAPTASMSRQYYTRIQGASRPASPLAASDSHRVHYKGFTYAGRRGGMVYAAVSKTAALTGLRVRVPSPAPCLVNELERHQTT